MSTMPRARRRGEGAATVLIVEDNAAVRGCLEAMFKALGYQAEVAADGHEALPKLEDGDYDAIICDLRMPYMDGDELYAACRLFRQELAKRFIFITGDVYGAWPAVRRRLAGQPQLLKPFRIADIQAAMSQVAAAS